MTLSEVIRDSTSLIFNNYDSKKDTIFGKWIDFKNKKELDIILIKKFEIDDGDSSEWKNRELIQSASLKNQYFKLLVSKNKEDFYTHVSGIKILDKKTDTLIQQINLNCESPGFENVGTGDFNFDGFKDFSVFERSYAGPNTSSLYFLYNPKTKRYFKSSFSGTSLEFDEKSKTIFEQNQCCAGTIQTTASYKVVNNKMVLIKQHCYIWDEKRQDLVEHKMKDCL